MKTNRNQPIRFCCLAAMLLATAGVAGCDDDDNSPGAGEDATKDLLSFQGSGCKFHEEDALRRERKLYLTEDEASFDGLTCLAWKTEPDDAGLGTLTLDVINYEGPCVTDWRASQAVSDSSGRVEIEVENPNCGIGSCGSCIYDWSFRISSVALNTDLAVNFTVDLYPDGECDDLFGETADTVSPRVTAIPQGRLSGGTLCRAINPGVLEWGGQTSRPDEPCAEDADCSLPDLFSCNDGLCRLKEVWVETLP